MRFKEVYVVACRAFSKSFITILLFLQCVFIPGTKRFICAPNKNQSAQIAKEKLVEIYDKFPLLRKEVIGGDISKHRATLVKTMLPLNLEMVHNLTLLARWTLNVADVDTVEILKFYVGLHSFLLSG